MFQTNTVIQKRATELYMAEQEQFFPGVSLPEVSELKESGYWATAKKELECTTPEIDPPYYAEVLDEIEEQKKALKENDELRETVKSLNEKLYQKSLNEKLYKENLDKRQTNEISLTVPELHMTVKYEPQKHQKEQRKVSPIRLGKTAKKALTLSYKVIAGFFKITIGSLLWLIFR